MHSTQSLMGYRLLLSQPVLQGATCFIQHERLMKMRKLFTLLMLLGAAVIVLGASGQALFAGTNFVFSLANDSDWENAANWSNGVPALVAVDDVGIANSAVIGAAPPAVANILRIGWSALAGTNDMGDLTVQTGGDLTVGHSIRIGEGAGSDGTLTIEAGATVDNQSVSATGEVWVGGPSGTGEMFVSGTLNAIHLDITCPGCGAPSVGIVNVLPGGIVNLTGRLTVGGWGGDASLLISPGGFLSTGDNWGGMLDAWELSGAISATPGATLVVTSNSSAFGRDYTAVAIPEPTSLALVLLGLGSVTAVRRRRNI